MVANIRQWKEEEEAVDTEGDAEGRASLEDFIFNHRIDNVFA